MHAGVAYDPRILFLYVCSQTLNEYSAKPYARHQKHRDKQNNVFILEMRELDFYLRSGIVIFYA